MTHFCYILERALKNDAAGPFAARPVVSIRRRVAANGCEPGGTIAPPAGTIPRAVTVTLGGGSLDPAFVLAQVTAAVARAAHLAPGARATLSGLTLDGSLRTGDRIAARASVVLDGEGRFAGVSGTTEIDISIEALPPLEPQFLMYSDDPETLTPAADGVLFADTIPAGSSARVYAYHASLAPERNVALALRARGGPSLVEVLGASAGPSGDYLATGHAATANYLRARRAQASVVLQLEPGIPVLFPIGAGELATNDLVAGIFDVRVLAGAPVEVLTVASSGAVDPLSLLDNPPPAGDGHFRKGTYALGAVPPLALAYTVGAGEPAPVTAGMTPVPRVRAARDLAGAYGVVQRFTIVLSNPSQAPAEVTLYEVPAGYGVTTTLFFDGEAGPLEVPCVKAAGVRYTVRTFALAPGERRVVSGDYMTDGASSYPLQFGLSETPAATPGAC